MQKKQLGNTDIMVSKICLWTMVWGAQNNEQEAHEQLDYAVAHWINFIDTAEMYAIPPDPKTCGLTETYVWNWLEKRWNRKDIILATKVTGSTKNNGWVAHVRNGEWITPSGIVTAIEWSLWRLKTDYIDLYQLHWPQRAIQIWWKMNFDEAMIEEKKEVEENIFETLKTLEKLQKEGKIRHIGLSNETPWWAMKFLEIANKNNFPEIQTIQNAYNLIRREYDSSLAEFSTYEWVGLLSYSPLAWWILTGKYQNGALPDGCRYTIWWKDRMPQNYNERTLSATSEYIRLADSLWISVTQLALAWANDRSFVNSNIIGTTSVEQLKECISSADIILSEDSRKKIDSIYTKFPNPCTF